MANLSETTFGNLQIDERFKKLERSLKLALLKKEYGRNINTGEVPCMTTWPSISSINVDTLDSSCVAPSLQTSLIKSEVLTSSNNLRNILLKKKSRNNQEVMATSSIKKYSVKQDSHIDQLAMPPPIRSTVYRTCKEMQNRVCTSSNCEKAASTLLNSSVQSFPVNFQESTPSCISANTNASKEYLHSFVTPMTSINDCQNVDRVFSNWRVMLNDHYELIIKGTLECGRLARSKPVIRRYTSTCVESKYKHKYSLQGSIVDEKNVLPDYIRGKFYNGFPDDWENVYQIWRTYISQGSPLMFRWPTPITDSDDDFKSELTGFTYTKNDKIIPLKETYESIEHTKIFENSNNKSLKEEEKCHNCSSCNQSYAKNTSINPFISNSKNIISVAQTKNIKSTYDEDNEQDVKSNVNILYSSKKMDKLQNILQKDKLNTIINNLADRNCSPKYIDKIIEMFNCLDYIMSYRTESEYNCDSVISASSITQNSTLIPLQQNLTTCNDDHVNSDKLGNKTTKLKNYMHSSNLGYDLGYGSVKNDSKPQLLNLINTESEHEDDKDSEKSESETYAGIPKISMERILKLRGTSKKVYRRKVTKKNYTNAQKSAVNSQYKAKGIENEFEPLHATIPISNIEKNLSSCVSLTEDEVKATNTKLCHKTTNVEKQEITFSNHQGRNNLDVHGGKKLIIPIISIKKNLPLDESCVSITEDEVEVTNARKHHKTTNITQRPQEMTLSHQKIQRKNIFDVYGEKPVKRVQNEQPPDASELSNIPTKNETPTRRSKPTIISSVPVNLNLQGFLRNVVHKPRQSHVSDVSIIENEDKQCANIQLSQEIHNKKSVTKATVPNQCLTAAIPVAIADDSKATTEIGPIRNNKSESNIDRTNSTKLTTVPILGQSKSSKPKVENNPKVLTAWMPKVVYYAKSKFESGLIFEGKLLNEAGHVIHRKFTTDIVLKRLSAMLIETVDHECYRLLGHLNDNKLIPKELAIQCRNGCPARIEQFCLTWKKLQQGQVQKIEEKLHNASIDSLNAPVSSRGRKIVPPLCYWEGERITLKDNIPIYSPGNSQKSSLTSLTENSPKKLNIEKKTKQKEDSKNISKKQTVNKQKLLCESNETSGTNRNQTIIIETETLSPSKSPKGKTASSIRRSDNSKKSQKSTVNSKRQVRQQFIFSSNDSEEKQKTFAQKRARKSQPITNVNAEIPSRYTLRKRQKVEVLPNKTLHGNAKHAAYYSPTKKSDMTCAYFQRDPLLEDFLSENELSVA